MSPENQLFRPGGGNLLGKLKKKPAKNVSEYSRGGSGD